MQSIIFKAGLIALLMSPTAVSGQSVKKDALDPNAKVCEVQDVVGSRLGKKRVCLTRAEWAERKKADRAFAEQIQASTQFQTCTIVTGGQRGGGTPAC